MEDKKDQKIEIRSEEVQDILGQVPSWIVRWGTVVILATVLVILAGSMIFRYPDIKRANILVTTENPPDILKARKDGQIERFFVEDSQFVKVNTHLAVIENPAEYSDVLDLLFNVEEIRTIIANLDRGEQVPLENFRSLGDIQAPYAEFVNAYDAFFQFLELDYHTKTIASLNEEIGSYQNLNRGLDEQVRILRRDFALAEGQYDRDKRLHAEGHTADAELDRSEQKKNQAQLAFEKSRENRENNGIQIAKLRRLIVAEELDAQQERNTRETGVREAFAKLIAEIDIWEQENLLKAHIDGVVSKSKFYSETQNVREGDIVMTVIPANPGEIIGKIDLPIEGSGKVDIGQTVHIQFTDFPYLQFGMVEGKVRTISQVPTDQLYHVEVDFPRGLTTYYDFEIPFRNEMFGRAEIITDKRVLIERIFDPIRSQISEQRATKSASDTDAESE